MKKTESVGVEERIAETFFDLLKEKSYKDISVSELIDKCGVNRSTFYRHFNDIFDLLDKTCNSLIAETVDIQPEMSPEPSKGYIDSLCILYYKSAMDNLQKITVISGDREGISFFRRLNGVWFEDIIRRMKKSGIENDRILYLQAGLASSYYVSKLFMVLRKNVPCRVSIYDEFTPDYSKSIIENLFAMHEKPGFKQELYRAAIQFWYKRMDIIAPFSIKTICRNAYISRSLFYTKYKNIHDFINEIEESGLSLISKFVLTCAFDDTEKQTSIPGYLRLDENNANAIKASFGSDTQMPFPFEVYRCVHTRFFDEIEKLKVQKFVEQNYELFEKYIFSVTYNAIVTLMTQDTEAFLLRAAGYNDIRKRLDF